MLNLVHFLRLIYLPNADDVTVYRNEATESYV